MQGTKKMQKFIELQQHHMSPCAGFNNLFEVMFEFDFQRSPLDHSLFIKRSSKDIVVMVVYVDDIILTRDNE